MMLKTITAGLLLWGLTTAAQAIPNQLLGPIANINSPLNGVDITDQLLAVSLWEKNGQLPGTWKDEVSLAETNVSYLLARPKIFGMDAVLVRATHHKENLQSIVVTLADAGSYFNYEPPTTKDQLAARRAALAMKQQQFKELYQDRLEQVRKALLDQKFDKAKDARQGATRTLRAELEVYEKDGVYLGLLADGHRLIRLVISTSIPHKKSWLDESRRAMSKQERVQYYRSQLARKSNGDVLLQGLHVVPQGYKPYCGLNTLVMSAHYFGLHVDEDWLAVAGKFQNTGSAGGSNMFRLYNATASEARLKISRETKFDFRKARSLIQDGLPVIVWRKFDSRRNALHYRVSKRYKFDPSVTLPAPTAQDRASWPGKQHPVHASVIVGYNDQRKEVLFLESWAGLNEPRRMRLEEMEATATWAFYFRNE